MNDERRRLKNDEGAQLVLKFGRLMLKTKWRADFAYGDTVGIDGDGLGWTSPDGLSRIVVFYRKSDANQ